MRQKSLVWILKRSWKLFDAKTDADAQDNQLGYAII
jgi:hypothetical protein